jgi:hypothetical protein
MKKIAEKILPIMDILKHSISWVEEDPNCGERVEEYIEIVSKHCNDLSVFLRAIESNPKNVDEETLFIFIDYIKFILGIKKMKGKSFNPNREVLNTSMRQDYKKLCEIMEKLSNL